MKIQFLNPYITGSDIKEAVRAIKSGRLTYSDVSKEFEKDFSKYLGVKETVLNSSGTAALHVSLLAAGIGPGDEVITTPLSYVATSNVILYVGAKPVFVDVEPETGLIDVSKVEKAITKKTKAIIPVHLYGQMADMRKLKWITNKHKILIIEDACHAIEAERDGIKPGQKSFTACFSFHVAKNITSGEGGAIITNDKNSAEKIRLLGEGGVVRKADFRFMTMLGYKYSLTSFQAALLLNQLKRIEKQYQARKKLWKHYAEKLKNTNGISFPKEVSNSRHAYHMFVIWVDPVRGKTPPGVASAGHAFQAGWTSNGVNPKKRDEIRKKLKDTGVQTSIHFNPIHLEPYYKKTFGFRPGDFPVAEKIGFSTITLPLYPSLTKKEQDYIVERVKTLV